MSFEKLNLIKPIQKALRNKGYEIATQIQELAIPVILERKDVLGCAQTGTGKTAAFAIPILQILNAENVSQKSKRKIRSLIVTPTRELAVQISESFNAYGKYTNLKNTVVFGGVSQRAQTDKLRRGVDILVATPGRLLDLMNQKFINLNDIKLFVLDEADRMLDMGFINDIKKIIDRLPEKRQSLFFSATMPPEIINLANSILTNPVKIEVSPEIKTVEAIKQSVYFVSKADKKNLLIHLLQNENIESALVFSRTKHGADHLTRILNSVNIQADSIHGNKSQQNRQRALNNFKSKRTKVLVATDIAARGIDIQKLSHVINFDIPEYAEDYIHRIGRTGRAGLNGIALSFCDAQEKYYLKSINKLIQIPIPVIDNHPYQLKNDNTHHSTFKKHSGKRKPGSFRFQEKSKKHPQRKFRRPKVKI